MSGYISRSLSVLPVGLDVERARRRFLAKVSPEPTSGCWLWTGCVHPLGYGEFCLATRHKTTAHRAAWLLFRGEISVGLEPDHLCRTRGCGNPSHLELVTHRENCRRGHGPVGLNARKTHCHRGHALTGVNLFVRPDTGARQCRRCAADRAVASRHRSTLGSHT